MRRRDLSSDETALWKEVAKSVRPLRRRAPKTEPAAETRAAPTKTKISGPAPAPRATPKPAPAPLSRKPSAFEAGDPRLDRKARRGQLAAERTLDLHGSTQARAASRLSRFLEDASADGVKCVLVITGKGAGPAGRADPFAAERGVLRKRFLDWVEEAPYRSLISRVAPAERGGRAGAFFIFLKSSRKR